MTTTRTRHRYPLQVLLSVLFSGLVLAAGLAVAWRGYVESRDIALAAADDAFVHIGRETGSAVREALEPVGNLAELLALQPLARATTLAERLGALPVLKLALLGKAPIAAAYAGYDDGSFFLVRSLPDAASRAEFTAPERTDFLVQSIELRRDGSRATAYLFLDRNLAVLERRVDLPYPFDPRTRPWFRAAAQPGQRVLTEPYVFYTTQSPGVTVAVRSATGSVIGVDVPLVQVSERLAPLQTVPGMRIVLFDEQRRLLARAGAERTLVRQEGNEVVLTTLDQFGEPVLATLEAAAPRAAPAASAASPPAVSSAAPAGAAAATASRTVDVSGQAWKTIVLPIPTERGMLSLGIAVPLDSLLENARAIRLRGILTTLLVLLLAVPLTAWAAHRVALALRRITREAEDIQAFRFDGPKAGRSIVLEVDKLANAVELMRSTIRRFLDITASLAAETDSRRMLDRVVSETSATIGASGGVAYLPADRELRAESLVDVTGQPLAATAPALPLDGDSPIVRAFRDGRTVVARIEPSASGASGNDAVAAALWPRVGMTVTAIPLVDREGEKVGVLALYLHGREPPSAARIAFVEALSGMAAVAIETQRLLEARKELLDAFIRVIAGAIDAKSRYTGGHCARVPELTLMLARAACEATDGPYRGFRLSDDEWEAVQIASWLHDCGKVTTPEYIVDKATKLETIYDRIHEVRMRFEVLKRDAEIAYWKKLAGEAIEAGDAADLERQLAALDADFAFVAECNEGGEFMAPDKLERLKTIAARTWRRTLDDRIGISHEERERKARTPAPELPVDEPLLADKPEHRIEHAPGEVLPADNRWGFRLDVPRYKYDRGELHNLAVARGTLTAEDRYAINHHIVQTIIMLSQLPFPPHLRQVPEIAGGHHETMDGNGYPRRIKAGELPPVARMMAIADIFEALTAADRPYKKAKKLSEAVAIMAAMKRGGHIDPELFDLFLTSGVYRNYAERFLQPEQIDAVDVASVT